MNTKVKVRVDLAVLDEALTRLCKQYPPKSDYQRIVDQYLKSVLADARCRYLLLK